jgi:hypothetical protein
MHVSLFRALKSANISDEAAEKVVHAFEEHIDMAVAEAMKHYDDRITAMQTVIEAKMDAGFKSMDGKLNGVQTSIDILKWVLITQGTLILVAGTLAGYVKILG